MAGQVGLFSVQRIFEDKIMDQLPYEIWPQMASTYNFSLNIFSSAVVVDLGGGRYHDLFSPIRTTHQRD